MRAFKVGCKSSTSFENLPKSLGLTQLSSEDYDLAAKSSDHDQELDNEIDEVKDEPVIPRNHESLVVLNYNTIRISILVLVLLIIVFGLMFACFLKWINCSVLACSSDVSLNTTSATTMTTTTITHKSNSCFSRFFKLVKKRIAKVLRWPRHSDRMMATTSSYQRGRNRRMTFTSVTSSTHSLTYGITFLCFLYNSLIRMKLKN